MITPRRSSERGHELARTREAFHTFHAAHPSDPLAAGFGALAWLDEAHLGAGAQLPPQKLVGIELVTWVSDGVLAFQDSTGASGVISAGEFQRLTPGRGVRHTEGNALRTDDAHLFQLGLRPGRPGAPVGREQRRFSTAERRDLLRVVASPDGREGSLRLHGDSVLFAGLLAAGRHVAHELGPSRMAWLHLVSGEVRLGDLVLTTGDGASISNERAVSITARVESELLLLDLAASP